MLSALILFMYEKNNFYGSNSSLGCYKCESCIQ